MFCQQKYSNGYAVTVTCTKAEADMSHYSPIMRTRPLCLPCFADDMRWEERQGGRKEGEEREEEKNGGKEGDTRSFPVWR